MPMQAGFPKLYAISDRRAAGGRSHREIVEEFLEGGARWIQIREKDFPSGTFFREVRACREQVLAAGGRLVVNDRADICLLAGASGVHLGGEDLSPPEARRIVPETSLLGVSTHSEAEAIRWSRVADYLAIGPVFSSRTAKQSWKPLGTDIIRTLRGRLAVPLVAIGGIDLDTAPAVLEAGADSVAVISDLLCGPSIRLRVRAYLDALGTAAN